MCEGCAARGHVPRGHLSTLGWLVSAFSPGRVPAVISPPRPVQLVWKNSPRGLVDALVGVGAEVVALGLDQVGRQPGRAVAVVEGQRAGAWPAAAIAGWRRPCATTRRQPSWAVAIASRKNGSSSRFASSGSRSKASLILPRKRAADDAPAPPHQRDRRRSSASSRAPCRLAASACSPGRRRRSSRRRAPARTSSMNVVRGRRRHGSRPGEHLGGGHPLVLQRRQAAGEHRLGDQRHRHRRGRAPSRPSTCPSPSGRPRRGSGRPAASPSSSLYAEDVAR